MNFFSPFCGRVALAATICLAGVALTAQEKIGTRPYELDWANRHQDDHPPLIDFEQLGGWRVECQDAVATFARTREQQIWGQYVGKLTYRGTGARPQVRVLPPQPVAVPNAFDAVTLWCYGNNWGWAPDPNTPQVSLAVLFEDSAGRDFSVPLHTVNWTEWFLLHRRLTPEQIGRVKQGAKLKGLLVTGGKNKDDRTLYFDNLAVFIEQFPPLKFEPRPERGIAMFPGQSSGANTGPGKLPFPNREETILPEVWSTNYQTSLRQEGDTYVFSYAGREGDRPATRTTETLEYVYAPRTGTWDDLAVNWRLNWMLILPPPHQTFQPTVGGGIYLQTPKGPAAPTKTELLGVARQGETVASRWRVHAGEVSAEVTYTLRLWKKSLVVDVAAPGGAVAEVRFGRAVGLQAPRWVTNPFYPAEGGRPAVAVSGTTERRNVPLFLTGHVDWYLSNGSILWAKNAIEDQGVTYHGGTRYVPKTDGKRNDCFERFFITVSPRYEEVLPAIPNPPSPWKHITGTRVWRAHGASNRTNDANYWTDVHRHGMTQIVVTDHETGWRDGGESFTFRTRPAPGKGGDQGQYDYARLMQDKLGFVYGPYNNYTDFAPVNEYWSADLISRTSDNQLQHAWMRCYAPKPARAIEYAAKLPPIIQEKFKFSTAYCDVHTAVAPWHRVDYDARVPGAGTMAAVFYAYGEIMLHQKKAWNGPVYSEGNYHSFYSGLTDGNYGQDQSYRLAENPWLVDFDLRQMHPLGCNFGMGNPDMFYSSVPQPRRTPEERDAWLDRFLAATVAFGHPGFLVMEGGMGNAMRSYYMLQQLHSRYCLTNVAEIRYANERGQLLDTSAAVASGAYKLSQVVSRYQDGTITAANGNRTNRLVTAAYGRKIDLPPNGYAGWTEDGAIEVFSGDRNGQRCDYAATPACDYVDGRGKFARFDQAAGSGIGVCRILPDNQFEIIPFQGAECGFAIAATTATALDKENRPLGKAELRAARGLTYVQPVKGAFSYRVAGRKAKPVSRLVCPREEVVPGETVTVKGRATHVVKIPADAKPGQRLWHQFEGEWIDFTVVAAMEARLSLQGNQLQVRFVSHLPAQPITVRALGRTQTVPAQPNVQTNATLDLGEPAREASEVFTAELQAGELTHRLEAALLTTQGLKTLMPLPAWKAGMRLRGQAETGDLHETGAIVAQRQTSCGGVERDSLFMHPPYQTGVGYSFALFEPVQLPAQPAAAFRALVGKGDGSDPGDGILYRLAVVDAAGKETVVAEQTVTNHAWAPLQASLAPWAGTPVRLKLITDVGVRNDSSGDWGCWAELRLESNEPVLTRALDLNPAPYRRAPGPYPLPGLSLAQLRAARSGWLRFDGKGLEGSGSYRSQGVLNGVDLGDLPAAGGDETKGVYVEKVGIKLNAQAIQSLGWRNRFLIKNPNRDCFSVRRFWLELELADGRKVSSDLSTATWSQPGEWKYAEGIGVAADKDIAVDIWFAGQ